MYYKEVEKMDMETATSFDWEKIDGQPRYRWYKNARNSVELIARYDNHHEIKDHDYSDHKLYFDSIEWVTQNDPEALEYIMGTLSKPVTQLVKDKIIHQLTKLGYYEACAIVKKHLRSYPVPEERTFQRKRAEAIKEVELHFVNHVKNISIGLYKFKTEEKHKLFDESLQDAFGWLLRIRPVYKNLMIKRLPQLEWLYENSPKDAKKLFSFKACTEIKEQFLQILADNEYFKLCSFIDKNLEVHEMDFYYKIPPFVPEQKNGLIDPLFDDDEDDDDDL